MTRNIIITRGLSGSGKTTWSKGFVKKNPTYKRINRDDLRFMLYDGDFIAEEEFVVTEARDSLLLMLLDLGYNVVFDEPYLAPQRIQELNEALKRSAEMLQIDLSIQIQDFIEKPIEECIANDMPRGKNRHVGEVFIRDYYENYVKPLLVNPGKTRWMIYG